MKPPLFHIGQAVVCLKGRWPGAKDMPCPRKGQVYKVVSLCDDFGVWWVELAEFGPNPVCVWQEVYFGPVEMSDEALAQLLEETLAPVTA